MKVKQVVLAVALSTAVFGTSFVHAQVGEERGDPTSMSEVLAAAPFRSAEGSITVLRVIEDGVAGVGIKREGKIGDAYRPNPEWARLPISEQVALGFEDLTGQPLTDKAILALVELEELKKKNLQSFDVAIAPSPSEGGTGKPLCPNQWDGSSFMFDCVIKATISKQASKPDDVCLLTAAIVGDHTQEISYKSINGNFYETHESNVYEGHYVAYQHLTGVHRTRKGQIFNAESSDKSRFNFSGDALNFGTFAHPDCLLAVE